MKGNDALEKQSIVNAEAFPELSAAHRPSFCLPSSTELSSLQTETHIKVYLSENIWSALLCGSPEQTFWFLEQTFELFLEVELV